MSQENEPEPDRDAPENSPDEFHLSVTAWYRFKEITSLITSYLKGATKAYTNDPESQSMMLLTVMDLWVASDKYATRAEPILKDHHTGFPRGIFHSLILPTREQMLRLASIEEHLEDRASCSYLGTPWEWQMYNMPENSFHLRYFDSLPSVQKKNAEIRDKTRVAQDEKWADLSSKKAEHRSLMAEYYGILEHHKERLRSAWGSTSFVCTSDCPKCSAFDRARRKTIEVFERPLPDNDSVAKAIVSEIFVSEVIERWRDTTLAILSSMLENSPSKPAQARDSQLQYPSSHDIIESSMILPKSYRTDPRFRLASRTTGSTSSQKTMDEADKHNVCISHGNTYEFFDMDSGEPISVWVDTQKLSSRYSYASDNMKLSEPLKGWILSNSHTSNEAIAAQADCPANMSIDELKCFGNLRAGVHLQWRNILSQLTVPTLHFSRREVFLLILQATNEAGPATGSSLLRDAHEVLDDEAFGIVLLDGLEDAFNRVKENWESDIAWCTLLSLATRLVRTTHCALVRRQCLKYLAKIRAASLDWSRNLLKKKDASDLTAERRDLDFRILTMALICVCTFDTSTPQLETALMDDKAAATLLESSITISEHLSFQKPRPSDHDPDSYYYDQDQANAEAADSEPELEPEPEPDPNPLLPILLPRWRRVCYAAEAFLRNRIVTCSQHEGKTCLDMAIENTWPDYLPPTTPWSVVGGKHQHVLVASYHSSSSEKSQNLQYNLLTGQLLMNGAPLSTLPESFCSQKTYKRLFGDKVLKVVPSLMPGMRFQAVYSHLGHKVYFGLINKELIVRTQKEHGDEVYSYELIPHDKLEGDFPRLLVTKYTHWIVEFGEEIKRIEFRPLNNTWRTQAETNIHRFDGLILNFEKGVPQCLTNNQSQTFIDLQSATFMALSHIFRTLELPTFIHLTVNPMSRTLDIELPRYGMRFSLACGDNVVRSGSHRGYIVDQNQSLGTLFGLKSKMVLRLPGRSTSVGCRAVIIPREAVYFVKEPSGHASSWIVAGDTEHIHSHFYQADPVLGMLKDNGLLQSKLFLCYLHGISSHCIPDSLTGRTGTEEAMRILSSAAARSIHRLNKEDIKLLQKIAELSPRRAYHPRADGRIEMVEWSELSGLAQDDAFYLSAQDILKQGRSCELFFSQDGRKVEPLSRSNEKLLDRHMIRSSAYRVSRSGAEHIAQIDCKYTGRVPISQSSAECRTYSLTRFLAKVRPNRLTEHIEPDVKRAIAEALGCRTEDSPEPVDDSSDSFFTEDPPPKQAVEKIPPEFDLRWLKSPEVTFRDSWLELHKALIESNLTNGNTGNKYKIMMLFAALTFAKSADHQIIQVLLLLAIAPVTYRHFTQIHELALSEGAIPEKGRLYNLAEDLALQCGPSSKDMCTSYLCGTHNNRKTISDTLESLISDITDQWPCEDLETPSNRKYRASLHLEDFMNQIQPLFSSWFRNKKYLDNIGSAIELSSSFPVRRFPDASESRYIASNPGWLDYSRDPGYSTVGADDLFCVPAPTLTTPRAETFQEHLIQIKNHRQTQPGTQELLHTLHKLSGSQDNHKGKYVQELEQSLRSFEAANADSCSYAFSLGSNGHGTGKDLFDSYLKACQDAVDSVQTEIYRELSLGDRVPARDSCTFPLWPRLTPLLLLEQLSRQQWRKLTKDWKICLVQYAISLTNLQRAERLANSRNSEEDLLRELRHHGHKSWEECMDNPEWLLFEVENSLLIRPVQRKIAEAMIQPHSRSNAVLQLNMGEGKSSVIVPIVASALADSSKLIRVIVTKQQYKHMIHSLSMKLGGLLGRRVYTLPISRQLRLIQEEGEHILALCAECRSNGGVLLVQLDHILSFKLLGLETVIGGNLPLGQKITQAHHAFDNYSRDIVDESDEIFNVKYELIYSMGSQKPLEFGPERWQVVQAVLGELVAAIRTMPKGKTDGLTIELDEGSSKAFPRIRVLQETAGATLLNIVARRICEFGLEGFSKIPDGLLEPVFQYITVFKLTGDEISAVEDREYLDHSVLLLLRGLFACGTLLFTLQKRWRVHYGLDYSRTPETALALPYRAKDTPALRSEFSHPDMVLVLTSLSHYYGGLRDNDLFRIFEHLLRSDQREFEYSTWVLANRNIPDTLRDLGSINIKDQTYCIQHIFKYFRHAKVVIDYYLANIIFPREMVEFMQKLSASSWDLTGPRRHLITGFSGTNDIKHLLPLRIEQLDQPEQQFTNAMVLDTICRSENTVQPIFLEHRGSQSVARFLLQTIVNSDPKISVILDVGAQILDLNNLDVARTWLKLETSEEIEAVIVFDDSDELTVVNRAGFSESFLTSPYSTRTAACLVFLDEAHTRGTDLRLPEAYRAAVMVGPNLVKDKLVQGTKSHHFCFPLMLEKN